MKSTLSLKTGRIDEKERREGEPERLTEVEKIGPERGSSFCKNGSDGTRKA